MDKYSGNNFFNDPSRIPFQKKVDPLNNITKLNRFETDIALNGRTVFEDKNNMINSLNEEISSLKNKLRFVYDKDKEINELKIMNNSLELKIKQYSAYETENMKFLQEKQAYQAKITELYKISSELSNEKQMLEITNQNLVKELEEIKLKIPKDDMDTTDTLQNDDTKETDDQDDQDLINIDMNQEKTNQEENIHANTKHLRDIISSKLVSIHDDKLNNIFSILNITETTNINRELISRILKLI